MTATTSPSGNRTLLPRRVSEQVFLGAAGLFFIVSAAVTVIRCRSMSEMGSMPMPGGWTMSMAWVRIPGQTWIGAAESFLGMWVAMMIAMMLPSATSMLRRYRRIVGQTNLEYSQKPNLITSTVIVVIAYFAVWTVLGIIVYGLGTTLAEIEMQYPLLARLTPILRGICVLMAGAVQLTPWKAHHLACCRSAPEPDRVTADIAIAWKQGFFYGCHCSCSCLNITVILLVFGAMDIRSMAAATVAITLERLAPAGEAVTRIIGVIALATGTFLLLQAVQTT